MKKTSFLKGLAMAAVAMVCAFTTSCSEEELSFNPSKFELPEAVANLTITVVDLEAGETLKMETKNVTTEMGKEYTVTCPSFTGSENYTTPNTITVNIPTVDKGQAVNVPVTFYVVKLTSAYAKILASMKEVEGSEKAAEAETIAATNDAEDFINKTAYDNDVTAKFAIYTGEEFVAIKSKAANTIEGVMGELMKFKKANATVNLTIAPWCQATVKVSQEFTTKEYTTTYNGNEETFTVKCAGPAYFTAEYGVIPGYEHDFAHNNHGHGHGHGSTGNAGGGIIVAE